MNTQSSGISESRLSMWRAVVAIVHADKRVLPQEKSFVQRIVEEVGFSEEQEQLLIQDLDTPKTCSKMFSQINDIHDIEDYFVYARSISWCDGDFSCQEKEILKKHDKLYEDEKAMNLLHHSRLLLEEVTLDCPNWNKQNTRVNCFTTLMRQLTKNNDKYHYYDDVQSKEDRAING